MRLDDLFSHAIDFDPASGAKPVLPTGGGVYLLTDQQDRLIQLASTADLKRAILGRLYPAASPDASSCAPPSAAPQSAASQCQVPQVPTSPPGVSQVSQDSGDGEQPDAMPAAPVSAQAASRKADLSQIVRRIRWQPVHSAFEATFEYWRIARVVMPRDYLKNIAFAPAWFVHVDSAAAVPRFTVSRLVPSSAGSVLGPFSTQQDANKFVQTIEDVFDLCREIRILEQHPHGQPCAYYEMGRCPAPCGGLIPMQEYRKSIEQAVRFAAGERQPQHEQWAAQMVAAASELAFERAAAVKQRIDRAKELDHAAFRYVGFVERFSWLIVQRGRGRTWVKPFFVRGGSLQPGEPAQLKQLDAVLPVWLEALRQRECDRRSMALTQLQTLSEELALVNHFLCRRRPTGLWFEAASIGEATKLGQAIRKYFAANREQDPTGDQSDGDSGFGAEPAGGSDADKPADECADEGAD